MRERRAILEKENLFLHLEKLMSFREQIITITTINSKSIEKNSISRIYFYIGGGDRGGDKGGGGGDGGTYRAMEGGW